MTPAQHELQAVIMTIFAEALGSAIAADEDFFAMGGDSLAAERVLAALSDHLSQDFPGWALLDYPSATALAIALCP